MSAQKVIKWIGIIALVVFFGVFILAAVFSNFLVFPFIFLWYLATGWIYFLVRKVPQMEINAEAVCTALIALGLLGLVVHFLMHRFFDRPAEGEVTARSWRFRWTAASIGVIVLLFAAGISTIGVTHQTTWMFASDEKIVKLSGMLYPSERTISTSNLKQIGLAMVNRHDQVNSLPLATTFDTGGRALHGWHASLLPYLEKNDVYWQIDFSKPWNHHCNQQIFKTDIRYFRSSDARSTDPEGYPVTNYAVSVDALGGDIPRRLEDYSQGTSNVIFAGEASSNLKAWGYPFNVRDLKLGLNQSPDGFGSPRKDTTLFVFGDGSVRPFRNSTDPEFLQYLNQQGRRK